MSQALDAEPFAEWFFTAPLEDTPVRRGDPLGMRDYAERMAEMLAPGLSNRIMDGRWLFIMCWATDQAYSAWRVLGKHRDGEAATTKEAAKELYAWLQPLEFLWVTHTVNATKDRGAGRQLPGVRAVRRWIDGGCKSRRFGLTSSARARYRFTGIYGAYRVALKALALAEDGWRLEPFGQKFAKIVRDKVSRSPTHRLGRGKTLEPDSYWIRELGLESFARAFLPTELETPFCLPESERRLLEQALFSDSADKTEGRRRRAVVMAAVKSSARTRPDLLADIADMLDDGTHSEDLTLLSPFCELADAGMAAMNACWAAAAEGNGAGYASVSEIVKRDEVRTALDQLRAAAKQWKDASGAGSPAQTADRLAECVLKSGNNSQRFHALMQHHNRFGGGLKWLALDGEIVKTLAPVQGNTASLYSFRLNALCRLGIQAGIIKQIPISLRNANDLAAEET